MFDKNDFLFIIPLIFTFVLLIIYYKGVDRERELVNLYENSVNFEKFDYCIKRNKKWYCTNKEI